MKLEHFAVTVPTRFLAALVALGLAASLANAGLFVDESGTGGNDFSATGWDVSTYGAGTGGGTMSVAPGGTRMTITLLNENKDSIDVIQKGGTFLPVATSVTYTLRVLVNQLETGSTVTVNYGTQGSGTFTQVTLSASDGDSNPGPNQGYWLANSGGPITYSTDNTSSDNYLYFGMTKSGAVKGNGIIMEIEPVPEPWVGALAAGVLGLVICQDQWRRRRTT